MRLTNMHFNSHGNEYHIDFNGAVHQLNPQPFTYDFNYNATYNTPEYVRGSEILQALRMGFICGVFGRVVSLVDYGCGNGAFVKFASRHLHRVYAYDVDRTPIEGVNKIHELESADIYTFHDSLEHIPDLNFLYEIPAIGIVVSLPWCHYHDMGQSWFDHKYPHRKPNEHLHHFDSTSLRRTMDYHGWKQVGEVSNHEDIIRKSVHGLPNILTMAFERK